MTAVEAKVCRDCKVEQPAAMFYVLTKSKDGLSSWCKTCTCRRARKNYHARPAEDAKVKRREYQDAVKELPGDHPRIVRMRETKAAWLEKTREHRLRQGRRRGLLRRYGITEEQITSMVAAQGGGCAICGTSKLGPGTEGLHVDHCHESGVVRGILCGPCNRGLGMFSDDADKLARAVEYLQRSRKRAA